MKRQGLIADRIEKILFFSKWMLTPFYLGLMVAFGIYLYIDVKEIIHFTQTFSQLSEEETLIVMLKIVDITMIANLVKMIITGSYATLVNKDHGEDNDKTTSGALKVKMATSLIGVSSIHLLQSFINAHDVTDDTLQKQLVLHGFFLLGALVLAVIELLTSKSKPH